MMIPKKMGGFFFLQSFGSCRVNYIPMMIPKKMEPQVWFWSVSQKKNSGFNSKSGFANQTRLWFWITWSETSG
jgi:hypothetical protein